MKIKKERSTALECLERRELLTFGLLGKNIASVATVPFSGEIALLTNFSTNFSAKSISINWGDGTATAPDIDTTTGQVVSPTPINVGILEIDASHTFSEANTYHITVTITDQTGYTSSATLTADVAQPNLNILPVAVTGVAGQPLSASNKVVGNPPTIATFLDPDLADTAAGYTAIVDWGDGSSSAGKVAGMKGVFTVTGDHTYAMAGTDTFTVTVLGYGNQASTTGTATIMAQTTPPSMYTPPYKLVPYPVVQTPAQVASPITVATFTDNIMGETPADLTALISWGDGDTSQGQFISVGSSYAITANYSYANPGTYPIAVSVTNNLSGQTISTATTANIVNSSNGASSPFNFTVGLALIPSNGPNPGSGATNTNRPTLSGTSQPFAIIQLTATLVGLDAPESLGQAIASGSGQWSLPVGPLADGVYNVTATVTPPGGNPQYITLAPNSSSALYQFTVDTQPPQLLAVSVAKNGNVQLTFADRPSGLNLSSLLNAANYELISSNSSRPIPFKVISGNSTNLPAYEQSIVLVRTDNPKNRHSLRQLIIKAGGIVDNAGNPLQAQINGLDVFNISGGHSTNIAVKKHRQG